MNAAVIFKPIVEKMYELWSLEISFFSTIERPNIFVLPYIFQLWPENGVSFDEPRQNIRTPLKP